MSDNAPDQTAPEQAQPGKLSRAEEWTQRIAEVKAFASQNQRWPSTTSKDETEKLLAQWWSRQKYYFNKHENKEPSPGINEEKAGIIREMIASFEAYERDGIWDTRFDLVVNQLKKHNKLWSYKTDNKEDEKVLRWWNQQKTFYRKYRKGENAGGMTEERAQKVEDVISLMGGVLTPRQAPKPIMPPPPQAS